ncbi:uncharacterized protein YxeA [Mucilaginibacter sp. HD30]
MKKILYGIAIVLVLISIILACTNPSTQSFTEYLKKKDSNRSSHETIRRENYFIFSTYSQSGGTTVDEKIWQGYTYSYIGIFGKFYLQSSIILN